jgi:hypothetical protein
MLSETPKRTRYRFPNESKAAATSPRELGSAEILLSVHVIPPSVLYFVISEYVSLTKRFRGFFGFIAMHSSALFSELLLTLILGPTLSVAAP